MQNSSYKNGETLVMGWCMQGVLFLRVHSHVSYLVLFLSGLLASHPCYPLFSLLSYRVVRVT